MIKVLTAATRGGKLAIAQTEIVISALKQIYPDIEIKVREITTKGDRDRKTALWDLKDSGFFTTQVEDTLLAGQADFAVHSLKDLPVKERDGLTITAVCERRFCEDCLVCGGTKVNSITHLPSSATIGTSSLRRAVQIKQLRKDLEVLPIRGNVPTRLKQVEEGKFDACLLARAGLERLRLAEKISICFDPAQFIPAPAQGALAVQTRCDDGVVNKLIAAIDDKAARITTYAERQILEITQCGCHAPVGAFANIDGNDIIIRAFISDSQGWNFIRREIAGKVEKVGELAKKIAEEILDAGGREILENLKK
jgi:hydroxymethylbilane synthase